MSAPWTEAHRREALRRGYEIAAGLEATRPTVPQATGVHIDARTVDDFRATLDIWGLPVTRVEREVRRVRALAEGRMVRETQWRIRVPGEPSWYGPYESREAADRDLGIMRHNQGKPSARVVRLTRIRRAQP